MLRTDLIDHRGTDDARLLRALADGDAIALAEAYHRTVTAAHACARRLLASPVEIEALMRAVYAELWEEPPLDSALEGWVRARCFTLGTGYLRQRRLRAPSASLAAWTSGIQADDHRIGNDALERMIAELSDQQQEALVRAHDQGVRTADQEDPEAGVSLQHALLVLASPLTDDERHAAEMCSSGVALANWIFGLLPPHEAATVPGTAAEPTPCGRLAGVLRRARRRFEPLPPTPDLGHRVLASVLGDGSRRETPQMRASRLDSDLRVASADLDRRPVDSDMPPSSLDMTLPASEPAESAPQPVHAYGGENGNLPRGWDDERPAPPDLDQPTPLRAPSGPPALASSGTAPPVAFGNAAPALAPSPFPDPDDPDGDDLVRMPLRGPSRSPLPSPGGDVRRPAAPADEPARGREDAPDDVTQPPVALRPLDDDDTRPPATRRPARRPLPMGLEPGDEPAPSPLSPEERRGSRPGRDMTEDSPLRRPAPQARDRDLDTEPHSLLDRPDRPERQMRPEPPAPNLDDTIRTPIHRDDSDPKLDDIFGRGVDGPKLDDIFGRGADDPPSTPPGHAATMTAPTLPAARRPAPQGARPAPTRQAPGGPPVPPVSHVEHETSTGGSILRWVVILLLIGLGAAFGIWLGQMLIA